MNMLERLVNRLVSRLGGWLRHVGVDACQYHALLMASLKMDFRSESLMPDIGKQRSTGSALAWTIGLYALFSALLAWFLTSMNLEREVVTGLLICYSMFMLATAILIEFGSTITNPNDLLFVRSRPISSRTYFAVKFSNLTFYILLFGVALSLFPALIGGRSADVWWSFALAYFSVAMLSSLFTASVIVTLYDLLMRLVRVERLKDFVTYVQVGLSFSLFFGYQALYQSVEAWRQAGVSLVDSPWAVLAPPFWFAGLIEVLLGHIDQAKFVRAMLALTAVVSCAMTLVKSVAMGYSDRQHHAMHETERPPLRTSVPRRVLSIIARWIDRFLLRDPEERAVYHLILAMLGRSRGLKLRLYPTVGMALALLVLSIWQYKKMPMPLDQTQPFFSLWSLLAFPFAAGGLVAVLPYSDEHRGHWIFRVAPLQRPGCVVSAIGKAALLGLFLPLWLINTLLLASVWPTMPAVWHSLYGLLIGYLTLQLLLLKFFSWPFSQPFGKGQQNQVISMSLVVMVMISTSVFLVRWLAAEWLMKLWPLALLAGAGWALGRLNSRLYARRLQHEGWAAEPQHVLG